MRKYNLNCIINKIAILCIASFIITGCSDFGDMNVDPNKVTTADPQLLLTNIEWSLASGINQDPLYATRVLVQSDGESSLVYYKWGRGSFGTYGNLRDIVKMQEEAVKSQSKGHQALALFFRSIHFYNLTMTFGDIPYSEALKGETESIYTPKYDTQEEVFKGILSDLKTANEILAETKDNIKGDIIYNGNTLKWQKSVNSFRLKVLMTLSKKENIMPQIKSEFSSIVTTLPIISSNADNMQVEYLDRQGNRYPLFNDSGFGSGKYMDDTFVKLMGERKDARLITFVTQTKNAQDKGLPLDDYSSYEGGNPIKPYGEVNAKAVAGNISKPLQRYYQNPTNEPKILLGYTESELIIAEAIVRGWMSGDAATHYNNAVRASFEYYNSHVPGYEKYLNSTEVEKYLSSDLVKFNNTLSMDKKIELIMIQNYIATYFQGTWSAYYNFLRTGYPKFVMASGVTAPTRWLYPQAEYDNNTENVKEAISRQFGQEETIRSLVWWLK